MLAFYGSRQRRGFITRWTVAGDSTARTITLPLNSGNSSAFNCTVNWGDGSGLSTVTAYNDAARIHTYTADGTYDVEIRGQCEGWSFNNGGDKLKFRGIVSWGSAGTFLGFRYLTNGFYGCTNSTRSGADRILLAANPDTPNFHAILYSNQCLSLPIGLLDNCVPVRDFSYFVPANVLTGLPPGLFDKCVNATTFSYAFGDNTLLASTPAGLFWKNLAANNWNQCFYGCRALQLDQYMFYAAGGQATRFLGLTVDFTQCFYRTSFTGAQGIAPDLWNCDYGETITLDVAPATDWAGGDVITGQSSVAVATVVSKVSALVYKIKKHFGTFTLGEIIGVTGTPAKLAYQGAANPTFAGTPVSTGCFGGAGNSIASLSNYADIPAAWK